MVSSARDGFGASLTIDLNALVENWQILRDLSQQGDCAAVIKANGYGLGLEEVCEALYQAGCRSFFVALPDEGARTRTIAKDAAIYVLDGYWPEAQDIFLEHHLRPVLGNLQEIDEWSALNQDQESALDCALHIDTGMNRLGLSMNEAVEISQNKALISQLGVSLVMSHPACADTPDHEMNILQKERFRRVKTLFPSIPASLANSAATLAGGDWIHDLSRPGIALYGGRSLQNSAITMKPVAYLSARILTIRDIQPGEAVGYGANEHVSRDSRIAIVAAGYADGYQRLAGSSDGNKGAFAAIQGHKVPLIGRVSMDLIALDVTDLPERLAERGTMVELLGNTITVDDVADHAQTIGYEILTGLRHRFKRTYIKARS
jgi:alanine racemase